MPSSAPGCKAADAEFRALDSNGDGLLSPIELALGLAAHGVRGEAAQQVFGALDVEGERRLSREVFRRGHAAYRAACAAGTGPGATAQRSGGAPPAAGGGGALWTDGSFPPDGTSLCGRWRRPVHLRGVEEDGRKLAWRRLDDGAPGQHALFGARAAPKDNGDAADTASPVGLAVPRGDDVQQGEHDDCWLSCAMSSACRLRGGRAVRERFGKGEEDGDGTRAAARGVWRVNIYCHASGGWRHVWVDDWVPVHAPSGELAFSRNRPRSGAWVATLQKAFAKLCVHPVTPSARDKLVRVGYGGVCCCKCANSPDCNRGSPPQAQDRPTLQEGRFPGCLLGAAFFLPLLLPRPTRHHTTAAGSRSVSVGARRRIASDGKSSRLSPRVSAPPACGCRYGSYEALCGGNVSEALLDLSGEGALSSRAQHPSTLYPIRRGSACAACAKPPPEYSSVPESWVTWASRLISHVVVSGRRRGP